MCKAVLVMVMFTLLLGMTETAAGQEMDIPVPRRQWEPVPEGKARLAIVIDDWGYACRLRSCLIMPLVIGCSC